MNDTLKYIGHINTPYLSIDQCPNNIQPDGEKCFITLKEPFPIGLQGLEVGQSVLILYWFEQTDREQLIQSRKGQSKGVFSLRSPHRPNPIAAATLPIEEIGDNYIAVRGLDCLDGTPLLDVKPAIDQALS